MRVGAHRRGLGRVDRLQPLQRLLGSAEPDEGAGGDELAVAAEHAGKIGLGARLDGLQRRLRLAVEKIERGEPCPGGGANGAGQAEAHLAFQQRRCPAEQVELDHALDHRLDDPVAASIRGRELAELVVEGNGLERRQLRRGLAGEQRGERLGHLRRDVVVLHGLGEAGGGALEGAERGGKIALGELQLAQPAEDGELEPVAAPGKAERVESIDGLRRRYPLFGKAEVHRRVLGADLASPLGVDAGLDLSPLRQRRRQGRRWRRACALRGRPPPPPRPGSWPPRPAAPRTAPRAPACRRRWPPRPEPAGAPGEGPADSRRQSPPARREYPGFRRRGPGPPGASSARPKPRDGRQGPHGRGRRRHRRGGRGAASPPRAGRGTPARLRAPGGPREPAPARPRPRRQGPGPGSAWRGAATAARALPPTEPRPAPPPAPGGRGGGRPIVCPAMGSTCSSRSPEGRERSWARARVAASAGVSASPPGLATSTASRTGRTARSSTRGRTTMPWSDDSRRNSG